jgi:DNA-binding MarR family transcriptional regulator
LSDGIINDVYTSFSASPTVPTPCACTAIKKLSRVLGRVYDAALIVSPMNVTQLAVLRCIGRRKGEPLLHVAKELEMDRSSLYWALNPMVREKWVLITSGMDARSRSAVITRKGQVLLKKAGEQWEKVQTRVVEGFGRSEWAAFVANIEKLRVSAEGDGKGSS